MAGLRGAGQFIGKAAPKVMQAFKGGAGPGAQALKSQVMSGAGKATRWAARPANRGAALGLAGTGLGTAALAGRATA
jgi:hypothetical protein